MLCDVRRPTCVVPPVGYAAWGQPDAQPCEACPACTADEGLGELLGQLTALMWWRLVAAVLDVIAAVAVAVLLLLNLCWAAARGGR